MPSLADSTKAYCTLVWHEDTVKRLHLALPMIEGPCIFSQYQSNVHEDDFNHYPFAFPSAEDGNTYIRSSAAEKLLNMRGTIHPEYIPGKVRS